MPVANFWSDVKFSSRSEDKAYVVQTSQAVIERCLLMTTDPGDLVIDPTCGSGTTAYVAEQWGRRWITIDTSRVALALARTRLMSARYPYYLLADSPEGVKKEAEITGRTPPAHKTENDIRKGFVYKRVPRVTLKSIANNPEIDSINAKWQEKLEPIRAKLNALLGTSWEEWDVPRRLSPHPDPLPQGEGEQDALRLRHAPHPDPLPGREGGQEDPRSGRVRGRRPTLSRKRERVVRRKPNRVRANGCSPPGGSFGGSVRRRSTPPSPTMPRPNCSTTSPMTMRSGCASPGRSRSRAYRRIGCWQPTSTATAK